MKRAAEAGDATAMYSLALKYQDGVGVEKSVAEAVRWQRASAEKGYALGMLALGRAYATGDGIARNQDEAVSWYRKAAAAGSTEAVGVLQVLGK